MQSVTRGLLGFAAAMCLLAAPAAAQCPDKTRVTDTVYNADGTPAAGRVVIAWPSYTIGGCQVIAGQTSVLLLDGVLDVELHPNDSALPAGTSYRATYYLRSGRITTEYWVVPSSPSPVGLATIRASSVPVPAVMIGIAQVTGLLPALAAKLELPSPCPAGRFLQSTGSTGPASLACVEGTGAPLASSTVSGTVKTEADEADPRVYTQAGVDALLAGKAAASHAHALADVTGLQTALDGKAAALHTHFKADITDFAHTHSAADVTAGAFGSERIAPGAIDQPSKLSASLCSEGQILKKLSGGWSCAPDATGDPGAVNWGDIGGTLSNQTDLQSALNGKQAADADLTAVAALTGTGFARRTGADTWTLAAASGTGSCTNQFVRGLNDNAAPTCATVGTADIADAAVSYAKIQNVAGFSVFGKATTGSGAGGDITAGSNGVLRRDGTGDLAFGTLVTGNIGDNQVTYAKLQQSSAGFVILGRATTGTGNYAEIAAGTDTVLRRSGSGDLAFGTLVTNHIGDSQITTAKIADANVTPAKLSNAARDRVVTWSLLDPATADSGKLRVRLPAAATIISVACDTDTGTASINVQKRSRTTPNTAGTNALSASLVCDSDAEETSTINSAAVSASELLALMVTATASTPTVVNVYVTVRLD